MYPPYLHYRRRSEAATEECIADAVGSLSRRLSSSTRRSLYPAPRLGVRVKTAHDVLKGKKLTHRKVNF
jgi:hypothetical protein